MDMTAAHGLDFVKLNLAQIEELGDLVGFPIKQFQMWKEVDGQKRGKWVDEVAVNDHSGAHLHTDVILQKISPFDIFKYYCPSFTDVGKRFCSEFREDTSNDSVIVAWNGGLLYKDFGQPEHAFNCFTYVSYKFTCTFHEALLIIDADFGLNLGPASSTFKRTSSSKPKLYNKTI